MIAGKQDNNVFLYTSHPNSGNLLERELRGLCCKSFWCDQDRAHALNESHGGMCFRIARRVEPGEMLTLHFGPRNRIQGRVAWCRRLETATEVGFQYHDHPAMILNWQTFLRTEDEPILALPAPASESRE